MTSLRPEVRRFARLLNVPPERVAYLESVSDDDIRALGRAVNDFVIEVAREGSVGVGKLARAIPVAVAAKVGERVGSPLVIARIAYFNEPEWAAKMAARLSPELVAGAVPLLDARRTVDLVSGLTDEHESKVLQILIARREWAALGEVFAHFEPKVVRRWADQLEAADLAQIMEMVPASRRDQVEGAIA